LIAIWAILMTLAGVVMLAAGVVSGVVQIVVGIAVSGLIGLTISWLVQALRAAGSTGKQRMVEQQYWQFMQQQQPGGYGYGAPPPPPPPPADSTGSQ
jgi:hypothetical protein